MGWWGNECRLASDVCKVGLAMSCSAVMVRTCSGPMRKKGRQRRRAPRSRMADVSDCVRCVCHGQRARGGQRRVCGPSIMRCSHRKQRQAERESESLTCTRCPVMTVEGIADGPSSLAPDRRLKRPE